MKKVKNIVEKKPKTAKGKRKLKQSSVIKLLSSFSAAALLFVFVMLIFNMRASNKFDVLTDQGDLLADNAQKFVNTSEYLTNEVRAYASSGDKSRYDNYFREIRQDKNREKSIEAMEKLGMTDVESKIVHEIKSLSDSLVPIEEKAIALKEQQLDQEAVDLVYGVQYESIVSKIHGLEEKLMSSVWQRLEETQSRLGSLIDTTFYFTFASLIIVVVLQCIIISYVLKSILRPLVNVEENMRMLADGQLNAKLGIDEDETELGQLAISINYTKRRIYNIIQDINYVLGEMAKGNFTVKLDITDHYTGFYEPILVSMRTLKDEQNDTLLKIDMASEQVAVGADQVSVGAQSLAQGATEQASAVQELSATINDISENAKSNSESTALALEHSRKAAEFVSNSAQNIREMVSAMNEISKSSNEISKIIATIENIAFQTNILALNAAVEAARAGAAGKGFAVVADEVRNLASKSDEAAKATKDLISSSINAVKNGESIVSLVTDALDSTIEASNQAEADIESITAAILKETGIISQVAEGIDQIASVVQTNSATSEESAAASEELSSQAQILKELVGHFRLNKES